MRVRLADAKVHFGFMPWNLNTVNEVKIGSRYMEKPLESNAFLQLLFFFLT